MRDEFEELCLLMNDPSTLVGQAYSTDHEMKERCQSFLCREGYDSSACDGFERRGDLR
ncbi:hypothetical protein [Parvularcula maris]|uniref:Uncharacterized protein n=1 Tax=Parvularcula maris TaxID=2965077 RepID=A0A9X2RH19_9PROT|nr:hypothetical protein [Parvularcula maris]MCQ8184394.1 hypothetical protein [Parvularcula maris]